MTGGRVGVGSGVDFGDAFVGLAAGLPSPALAAPGAFSCATGSGGGGADPRNAAAHCAVMSRYLLPYTWLGSMYVPSGNSLKLVMITQSGDALIAACHERA